MSNTCFQLKGSVITIFILELYRYSRSEFAQQLSDKVNQAPELFYQSPVIISLGKVAENTIEIDFIELLDLCQQSNLQPIAFKSADNRFIQAINATGIPLLSETGSQAAARPLPEIAQPDNQPQVKLESRKSKVITRPVRSGQQVYAEGTDLIILSQVSEGAEVLADGNIHVYGALRGRALAGIQGDTSARVFCQKLEAELISIAGHFILSDAMRDKAWKQAAHAYLDEQTLHVEAV